MRAVLCARSRYVSSTRLGFQLFNSNVLHVAKVRNQIVPLFFSLLSTLGCIPASYFFVCARFSDSEIFQAWGNKYVTAGNTLDRVEAHDQPHQHDSNRENLEH